MATFTVTESGYGTYQGQLSNIVDGSTSTSWQGNSKPSRGAYVLITASQRISLSKVVFTSHSSDTGWAGNVVQVSQDGTDYTDIGSLESTASAQAIALDSPLVCQYVRIYCESASGSYAGIAEVALTYADYTGKRYAVTVEAGSGITVDRAATEEVSEGEPYAVTIYGAISTVTDNGADVMGKLEERQPETGGTASGNPTAYATSGTISGTRYKNCVGKGSSATATGNDYASGGSSSTARVTYSFDFSAIPESAVIDSVSVKVGGHCENASRSTATLQLYSGSTAKGAQGKFSSTSKQVVTLDAGTWTRAELQDAKLVFTIGYYGGLVNGVDFDVGYSVPGSGEAYHVYSIPSVNEAHAILINVGGDTALRARVGGEWKVVRKVFERQGGAWVEVDPQEALDGFTAVVRIE